MIGRLWRWLFGWGSYEEYLRSRRWRKLRQEAMERDGYRCRLCNARYHLEVHHRKYAGKWGQETVEDLTTLCAECHRLYEWFRKGWRDA